LQLDEKGPSVRDSQPEGKSSQRNSRVQIKKKKGNRDGGCPVDGRLSHTVRDLVRPEGFLLKGERKKRGGETGTTDGKGEKSFSFAHQNKGRVKPQGAPIKKKSNVSRGVKIGKKQQVNGGQGIQFNSLRKGPDPLWGKHWEGFSWVTIGIVERACLRKEERVTPAPTGGGTGCRYVGQDKI